ncbi:MAG: hypothetical protein HFH45_02130 [Bacilli bacterium]|nr:hypothetical protein [Bacilli bacterium]
MRKFEKISLEQFKQDTGLTEKEYELYHTPKRSTKYSAGYDFMALTDFTINPNEIKLIPTGIKADMNEDEVLMIYIRSSLGFKFNLRMCNQTGIIDKDYYNNQDNEGHIFVKIQNEGNKPKEFKQGENIVQGIFTKFLTVDDEETIEKERSGGFGSTNK